VCASGDDDGGTNLGGLWLLELTDGQWLDVGGGLPGPAGVPVLTGTGNTTAGARVALALADGAPSAPVSLVVGGSAANQALLGGVLVPSPDVVVPLGSTDAGGALDVALRWPSGVPTNTTLWIQAWLPDAAAPLGWAASGALVTTTP
jgi:hypothetical protein